MRNVLALTIVVLLALAGGCKQSEYKSTSNEPAKVEQTTQAQELTPEQLGELGAKIRKTPDRAKELLTQHGLDEKSFEAQIRKVTENPDASKRYAEAYKKASA